MSERDIMLPFRQKQIVERIKALNFNTKEFEFTPINNDEFLIKYKTNPDYHIRIKNNKHYIKPAQGGKLSANGETANFETALIRVDYWLNAVRQNLDAGNPWGEVENAKERMHDINFNSYNEVFNTEEQKLISKKLEQLFAEITLLQIDTKVIRADIEHLNSMSAKVSKKDWIVLLLGIITSWIFTGIMPPEHTSTVWESIRSIFSGFKLKFLE